MWPKMLRVLKLKRESKSTITKSVIHAYKSFYLGNERDQSKLCVCVCAWCMDGFLEKLFGAADL